MIGKIRESKDENFGFNAETGEYGDMVKMGVIDPAKVTRLALQNAASIAGLMLTTEALVAEIKEDNKKRLLPAVPPAPAAWAACTKPVQGLSVLGAFQHVPNLNPKGGPGANRAALFISHCLFC